MKIKGKIKGDMVGFSLKHNPDNGTRFAYVSIAIPCDRDRIKTLFGAELETLAFGSMVATGGDEETEAGVSFGYKKAIPSQICEFHRLDICEHTNLNVQPEVMSIAPIKDEQKVTVVIKLPILVKKDKKLAGTLATEFGELIEIELEPAQQSLPLEGNAVVIRRGKFGNPEPVTAGA